MLNSELKSYIEARAANALTSTRDSFRGTCTTRFPDRKMRNCFLSQRARLLSKPLTQPKNYQCRRKGLRWSSTEGHRWSTPLAKTLAEAITVRLNPPSVFAGPDQVRQPDRFQSLRTCGNASHLILEGTILQPHRLPTINLVLRETL